MMNHWSLGVFSDKPTWPHEFRNPVGFGLKEPTGARAARAWIVGTAEVLGRLQHTRKETVLGTQKSLQEHSQPQPLCLR